MLLTISPGEGKTIVALLPTFLAALEDKGGVFVVTPNDYLARRDAENVGQVLRFLGLTVGLVQSTMEVRVGDVRVVGGWAGSRVCWLKEVQGVECFGVSRELIYS